MLLPRLALLAALALAPLSFAPGSLAQSVDDTDVPVLSIADLGQVLQFDSLFEVLRDEGIAGAEEMADQMLPGGAGLGWDRAVAKIYDLRLLRARFNMALRAELTKSPQDAADIRAFFATDLGQRVIGLEIAARRAFLEIATEEAARVAADTPENARDPKWRQIQRLIAAGDLVEMNVAGGLSGSLAFSQGMQEAGVRGMALSSDRLSTDVWGQEAQLRADTGSWLKAYFGLAYAPLTEAELETYVTFMESPAGRRYSAALFLALDASFRRISHDLGAAIGDAMQAREI